ncbi:DUF4328 domain-containing protein [Kribbella sp. NBC_01245]|uniref:DUF4328 domain-containing protein n=1 Tax=Kribbella sp. NBC_01245 TaxID=2903578 RepID=UPI002E29DDC5|nr:DUF4328 domain-containing protein [Kribbella sp. NBC_01245]
MQKLGVAAVILMAIGTLGGIGQTVLLWQSYSDLKRIVFGLSSEEEVLDWADSLNRAGPLLNLGTLIMFAGAIVFLVWLWQARETAEALDPDPQLQPGQAIYQRPRGVHRLDQGWVIGSWFCPIVQFWYPLRIVQDVDTGSRPKGEITPARDRGIIYTWWTSWCVYWVISIGGMLAAFATFLVWIVQFVEDVERAEAANEDLDIYGMQDFLLRFVLVVFIAATIAMVGYVIALVTISILIFQISGRLDQRLRTAAAPPPPYLPPAPQQQPFPTYGGPTQQQSPYRPFDR